MSDPFQDLLGDFGSSINKDEQHSLNSNTTIPNNDFNFSLLSPTVEPQSNSLDNNSLSSSNILNDINFPSTPSSIPQLQNNIDDNKDINSEINSPSLNTLFPIENNQSLNTNNTIPNNNEDPFAIFSSISSNSTKNTSVPQDSFSNNPNSTNTPIPQSDNISPISSFSNSPMLSPISIPPSSDNTNSITKPVDVFSLDEFKSVNTTISETKPKESPKENDNTNENIDDNNSDSIIIINSNNSQELNNNDNECIEQEDLFEQAYDIAKILENKLKDNNTYNIVENEMKQLLDVFKSLESHIQERDEDSKRLLMAVKFAKNKGPAPTPQIQNNYSNNDIKSIIKMQRLWRRTRGDISKKDLYNTILYYRSHPDNDSYKKIQWHKTLREIMKYEQSYVRKLYLLVNCFCLPLEKKLIIAKEHRTKTENIKNSGNIIQNSLNTISNSFIYIEDKIITKEQFDCIFLNFKVFLSCNEVIQKKLKQNYYIWPRKPLLLSSIYEHLLPYLKSYYNFINNYENHLITLLNLRRQNKQFINWYNNVYKTNFELSQRGFNDITDLSITPIQYISKINILLKKIILNNTLINNNNEITKLQNISDEISKLLEHTKDIRTISENMKNIYSIQCNILGNSVPNLMDRNRYFIKSGSILTLTDRIHRRNLHVFNDYLLVTKKTWKPGSNEQVLESFIPLKGALIVDDADVSFSFRICYDNSSKYLTFIGKNDEDKALWMRDITNALADSVSHLQPSQTDLSRNSNIPLQISKTPSKQGYLSKMEGGFIKTWKTRWIQITSGILYSFVNDSASVPLKSYELREFIIKQLYVTDTFTRFCIHMIQLNGKRQIILSTYSKKILEEWISVLKCSVDMNNSLVFGNNIKNKTNISNIEPPPIIIPSEDESEKSFTLSRERFFPKEVSDQFIETVNEKQTFRLFLDNSSSDNLQLELNNTLSSTIKSKQTNNNTPPIPSRTLQSQNMNDNINESSILPSFDTTESIVPPSPFDIPTSSSHQDLKTKKIDFSTFQSHNESSVPQYQQPSHQIPQAVIAFQSKFNLPPTERPIQYFPLASGCFIYLTQGLVCVESLFQGNQSFKYVDIIKLHKSKPGILGKGTGGRIELTNGTFIELSGMIKRRDTFQAIVAQSLSKHNHKIQIYRDGYGLEK